MTDEPKKLGESIGRFEIGFGTLYTSAYWPAHGRVEYRWPGEIWSHKVGRMEEGTRRVLYPENGAGQHFGAG